MPPASTRGTLYIALSCWDENRAMNLDLRYGRLVVIGRSTVVSLSQ